MCSLTKEQIERVAALQGVYALYTSSGETLVRPVASAGKYWNPFIKEWMTDQTYTIGPAWVSRQLPTTSPTVRAWVDAGCPPPTESSGRQK